MDFECAHEICEPHVVAEEFDGDVVILNLDDGCYFSLDGLGPTIWQSLVDGLPPNKIVARVKAVRKDLETATIEFLEFVSAHKLVRPSSSGQSESNVEGWNTLSTAKPPVIDVFDDLADLILADPIHDVDAETGAALRKAA